MKQIVLILLMALCQNGLIAQNCTLRLHLLASPQFIGDEFFIELWMDVLEYPDYPYNEGVPTLHSGFIGIEFDPAVMTPIKTDGPIPLQRWAWNMNQMFDDNTSIPAEGYPSPGDLRFVIYGTSVGGMDPFLYGGMPFHLWDLKFIYNGGNIILDYQDETFWNAYGGVPYEMTFIGCSPSIGIKNNNTTGSKIWSKNHKIYVQSPELKGDIVVFNLMGQEVVRTKMKPGLNVLPVDYENTCFVVKVSSTSIIKTVKLFVN